MEGSRETEKDKAIALEIRVMETTTVAVGRDPKTDNVVVMRVSTGAKGIHPTTSIPKLDRVNNTFIRPTTTNVGWDKKGTGAGNI